MLVGWGGNNGNTFTAGILANKLGLTWNTKNGSQSANYFGSLTQSTTTKIGIDLKSKEVYIPLKSIVPMLNPNDIVVGEISG